MSKIGDSIKDSIQTNVNKEIGRTNGNPAEFLKQGSQLTADINEKWSEKYKKSIDCNNPKGFSQRAHCQGKKKNVDESEKLHGGKSDNITLKELSKKYSKKYKKNNTEMYSFLKKELQKGIKVELEHTKDENIAKEIAKDHLSEDPKYYQNKKTETHEQVVRRSISSGTGTNLVNTQKMKKPIGKIISLGKVESKEATASVSGGQFSPALTLFSKDKEAVDKEKPKKIETKESSEIFESENTPTNPSLWSRAKSLAKSKFDVYPSAYANGWAAKWYKSKGGGWRKKKKKESKEENINEDLRRWFKEKWVDVSKKVDGKHPPCGRKDADGKSYPKCRPSKKVSKETPKVASSYSKEEKKSMTQQKRRAEKKEPKLGKGNKPTMTHYENKRTKKETKEGTSSTSSGQYSTPKIWAKSMGKKNWVPSRKTQIPGGKFVTVKEKCKKFPYCNQGDIKALNIFENERLNEIIRNIEKKYGISENIVKSVIQYEIEKLSKNK